MARKTQTDAADAPVSVELDFGTLNVVDVAELPKTAAKRESVYSDTHPVVLWLVASREAGTAKAVSLPSEDSAKAFAKALRGAAAYLDAGVKIRHSANGDGSQIVTFQAGPKRAYNRKPADSE